MRWVKCKKEQVEMLKRKWNMKHDYDVYFDEFMDSGEYIREVEWDKTDYTNHHCAYNALHVACQKSPYPIRLRSYRKVLYIVRTDM